MSKSELKSLVIRYAESLERAGDQYQIGSNENKAAYLVAVELRRLADVETHLQDVTHQLEAESLRNHNLRQMIRGYQDELTGLRARVETTPSAQAAAESARLDWCISVLMPYGDFLVTDTGCGCCGDRINFKQKTDGRAAIDAARGAPSVAREGGAS